MIRTHRLLNNFWSDIETRWLAHQLPKVIDRPIFVCGLARAGTTVVTQLLNQHPDTGSLLYKDVPFVQTPYFWQFISPIYYGKRKPERRLHGDDLLVHLDAPDAFEELVWMQYLDSYDDQGFCRALDDSYSNESFEHQWSTLIRKVLYVRGASRYLAKGNYNLLRLRYILKVFPDAKIIICFRDPFQHAQSLARVHGKFSEIAAADSTFVKQLDQLGHFEFGPHRRAICLKEGHCQKVLNHWKKGEDYEGYLLQWLDVYQFARDTYKDHPNILWLDSEALRQNPESNLSRLMQFCELLVEEDGLHAMASLVRPQSVSQCPKTPYDQQVKALHRLLGEIDD